MVVLYMLIFPTEALFFSFLSLELTYQRHPLIKCLSWLQQLKEMVFMLL